MLHRIPPTHSASDLSSAPEQSIGKASDYKVGDKKEVKVGDATALIVCTKKGLFAVGSRCTHYGAPLEKGVLDGCRLKCPWHGAVRPESNIFHSSSQPSHSFCSPIYVAVVFGID